MTAPRPEPAPAMGFFNHVSFGDSVWALADDDEMEELPSTVKLAFASADLSFSNAGAGMSDVARVLHDCKPTIHPAVMAIREQTVVESVRLGQGIDASQGLQQLRSHMQSRPPPRVANPNYAQRILPVRHLCTDNSGINAQELDDISALLFGNASLATLALQGNELLPRPSGLFARLALSISMSTLRVIELGNNAIGPRSMCEFLQHLSSPNLSHLHLSMTMQEALLYADQDVNPLWRDSRDQSWRSRMGKNGSMRALWVEEVSRVTDLLIAAIRSGAKRLLAGQAPGAPFVPRLEVLSLNANDLRWRNVKRLVSAILQDNTSLLNVELFATCDGDDSDDEDANGAEVSDRNRRGLRRVSSIGSAMMDQRRQSQGPANSTTPHAGDLTPPRGVGIAQNSPGSISASDNDHLIVRKDNWRDKLVRHLRMNRDKAFAVKRAARHLLGPARILACKCSYVEGGKPQGVRLPPEIWRRILLHLGDTKELSRQQIERIISFAGDPSTIGFGLLSANQGLSCAALNSVRKVVEDIPIADVSTLSLVPHRAWNWDEMISFRSIPRDWPAQIIDQTPMSWQSSNPGESSRETGSVGPIVKLPSRTWRTWLEEQSSLQAFLEAAGAFCAERDDTG